ncbi:MAG: hypothetical protein IT425_02125 [Pirellulales bacterium]|nr:hypothetical protein [Pirellulales bacterium]
MNISHRFRYGLFFAGVLGLGSSSMVASVCAQAPSQHGAVREPTVTKASQAEIDAERVEIWNSPDMLRARAWLKDYCSKSVKVTPEMAKQYESELANMSPNQMRLWLMKFDEQEQERQQQSAMFHQYNAMGLQQAAAAHRQTQQAYAALNEASSAAAGQAQKQITAQREAAQQAQEDKRIEQSIPTTYNPYANYFPYGLYGPYGAGGIHYHIHNYGN